jgi:hypothetical protein
VNPVTRTDETHLCEWIWREYYVQSHQGIIARADRLVRGVIQVERAGQNPRVARLIGVTGVKHQPRVAEGSAVKVANPKMSSPYCRKFFLPGIESEQPDATKGPGDTLQSTIVVAPIVLNGQYVEEPQS